MTRYVLPLGPATAAPVTIYAPGLGEIDFTDLPTAHLSSRLWGLDVESMALRDGGPWHPDWYVRTIQLAPDDDFAYVLRLDDEDQREIAQAILQDPRNTFCSHTQIDVIAVRQALGIDIADRNIDTHWLSVASAPDDARGQAELKPVAKRFGMPQLEQAEKELDATFNRIYHEAFPETKKVVAAQVLKKFGFDNCPVDDPVYAKYAGLDAIVVRRLLPLLAAQSRAPRHLLLTERWLSTQAIRMRIRGHRVDRDELDRIETGARETEVVAAADLRDICGLKTTQNVALVKWLTDQGLDWEGHPTTKSGAPSLSKDYIPALLARPDEDLPGDTRLALQAFLRSAQVLDRVKRCTEIRQVMDQYGRVHPTLITVGTVTSRMSSSSPNMQNFSKADYEMRGLFLAEDEYTLISCDFAQIELRVIAALAGEAKMIKVILEGGDLHQLTADLLGITRQQGKTVNFLIVYGGGAARLAAQLNWELSLSECKRVISTYWRQYPAIARLSERMRSQVGLRLISGRYVPTGRYKDGGLKVSANPNYLIQGSSRELLVGAWRRFCTDPTYSVGQFVPAQRERMMWMMIHDEIVLQVPTAHAPELAHSIQNAMTFDFYGVPIQAESDLLLDANGVSRWMSGDHARSVARELAAA